MEILAESFEPHKTSCKYLVCGFHYAFAYIDYEQKLIYLDVGGDNLIPVRLSDVEQVHVMGLGELKIEGNNYRWEKW